MKILDFIYYGYKYFRLWGSQTGNEIKKAEKVLFVAAKGTEDWILGAKARRLERYSEKGDGVVFAEKKEILPEADGCFYLHHKVFSNAIRVKPSLLRKKNVVMFTHPVIKDRYTGRHFAYFLNKADKVIFLNKAHAEMLISYGLEAHKTVVMHLASDAEMFQHHERNGQGKVVISMGYYGRKNPDLLMGIIDEMAHREFILIGRGWRKYDGFEKMNALPNLEYYDSLPYEEYPRLYAESDVFLSTSKLEGGPVPLLETMLCNIVPVASKTGFCVDIINHGENGFLFDIDAKAEEVISLIEQAYNLKANTRSDVLDYTWQKSAEKIDRLFD